MNNKIILFSCCILATFFWLLPKGYGSERTPEHMVREFYAWYFHAENASASAENNDEIFDYVHKKTVMNIRNNKQPVYYFTKMGGYASEWNEVETVVEKAHAINETMSLVPVRFILPSNRYVVFVVVSEEGGKQRITKVIDAYPDI